MRLTPLRALVPSLVVLAVALTGCSGGEDADSPTSGGAADNSVVREAPESAQQIGRAHV
jgi:hypothetical protein